MKLIGVGNLSCDLYYLNNNLVGVNGGKSFSNIIFNLSNFGMDTSIFGLCGNDIYGKIAINSLNNCNVDTTNINIINQPTNIFHIDINKKITTKRCPKCNNKKNINYSIKNINYNYKNNIFILDSINYLNLFNLNLIKNNFFMIDIGYFNEFENISEKDLDLFLNFKFEIINMNKLASNYLVKKLKLNSEYDLLKKINTKLLIITNGKKGANFYSDFFKINLNLFCTSIGKEIDTNGAGDLFFSYFIKSYIDNNFLFNTSLIYSAFNSANKLTSKLVNLIGSRTIFQQLYKISSINDICTCEKVILF